MGHPGGSGLAHGEAVPTDLPTVLICDDEPLVVSSLSMFMRRAGLDPVPVTSSDDLWAAAIRLKPQLIVLDIRQGIDGRRLLAGLKAEPLTRDIQVVMVSGDLDPTIEQTCLRLGAALCEQKPLGIEFLDRLVTMARAA
jgi:CheY-like chemotaxis protein